jgi:hypothetical protein
VLLVFRVPKAVLLQNDSRKRLSIVVQKMSVCYRLFFLVQDSDGVDNIFNIEVKRKSLSGAGVAVALGHAILNIFNMN